MDAFELLLRASDPDLNQDLDIKDFNASLKAKAPFDYRDHMRNSMFDPVDSIMMLADQACQKSPIKKGREGANSPGPAGSQPAGLPPVSEFGDDSKGMGTLLQYGSYFSTGSPYMANSGRQRSRAMSEPWLRQDNWSEELQFNRTMGTAVAGNAGNPAVLLSTTALSAANTTGGSSGGVFPPFAFGEGRDQAFSFPRTGLFNAEQQHRLGYSSLGLETSLPHMLDQYASIYNKNGRIGIYTREERSAIIHRFREKRKRRVWKKKIRYFCRKNLADRRVRVKGRFVKSAVKVLASSTNSSTSGGSDHSPTTSTTTSKSLTAAGAGAGSGGKSGLRGTSRGHSSSGDGTDVSDLTYAASLRGVAAGAGGAPVRDARTSARQALTSPGSDDDEDNDNDDEEDASDEGEDGQGSEVPGADDNYSMEVVVGAEPAVEAKAPRRLKLVLGSGAAEGARSTSSTSSSAAMLSPNKLVFRAVKQEVGPSSSSSVPSAGAVTTTESSALSGVDLLASLAARTGSDSDVDDQLEDGDLFSADVDVLRLPSGKRMRRHSIAY